MTEVKSGDVVRIHYTGKLADGTEFDSSAGREPLEFQVGAGQIIPGLDNHVEGMTVGEQSSVTVPADQAYGPRDEAQVQAIPRSAIPDTIELSVGARLHANTQDGRQIALTVTDFDDESVTVDANHPLAGRDLVFDVEVVEVVASEGTPPPETAQS
ncbi:peptidylprolyl isomerase [Aquibium sp. A9E412]|uniref:FKBP-type peptidyl-prolyl cis-trans isomerase n=1 Tax=Aquibium sp. A9E412 TaxID=2976767 RepID=UPI0025B25CEC|nr:peptidylprolyl isomerase [Aquibium sp. A9E412]MDN2565504.1 peptidylprolyl isomerase [Aquibium sp. A9E412]